MHSIKLDIHDSIFDKVMFFLKNIPANELKIQEIKDTISHKSKNDIVDFFQKSPLVGEIEIDREKEIYKDRASF
jgi:hypothetical protein